ncbi:hypothetical protein ACFU53_27205 [Streptomyces sp. NPDC057474]|uniref:hypothetical protein n=1 Tax=Streptomyces sp. NPDC057474 TaxID=3346144 RepID=UPI0036CCE8AC
MSTLEFKVLDLDSPVGGMNKTPTLATGEQEAMLVNAGPTREHRRLAANPRSRQEAHHRVLQSRPRRPGRDGMG